MAEQQASQEEMEVTSEEPKKSSAEKTQDEVQPQNQAQDQSDRQTAPGDKEPKNPEPMIVSEEKVPSVGTTVQEAEDTAVPDTKDEKEAQIETEASDEKQASEVKESAEISSEEKMDNNTEDKGKDENIQNDEKVKEANKPNEEMKEANKPNEDKTSEEQDEIVQNQTQKTEETFIKEEPTVIPTPLKSVTPGRRGRPKKIKDPTSRFFTKEHCSEILNILKQQRENGNYCDIIINMQGRQYWAHRSVLAANSSYFQSTLNQNSVSTSTAVEQVTLPCNNHNVFKEILDFMYTGYLSVNDMNVNELLDLAELLSLEVVKRHCESHLVQNLTNMNWTLMKGLAQEYALAKLLKSVYTHIVNHIEQVSEEEAMMALTQEEMTDLLSQPGSSYSSSVLASQELCKLITLMRWVNYSKEERQSAFEVLIKSIDPLMLDMVLLKKILEKPEWQNSPLKEEECFKKLLESLESEQERRKEEEKSTRSHRARKPDQGTDYFYEAAMTWAEEIIEQKVREEEDAVDKDETYEPPQPVKRKRGRPRKNDPLRPAPATPSTSATGRTRRTSSSMAMTKLKVIAKVGEEDDLSGAASADNDNNDEDYVGEDISGDLPETEATEEEQAEQEANSRVKNRRKATRPMRLARRGRPAGKRKRPAFFKCEKPDCSYVTRERSNFEDHMNVHKGIRAHTCMVCDKSFFSRKHMKRHANIHLDTKSHVCEYCGYASYRQDKLRHHTQRRHPEIALERGWIDQAAYEALKTPKPRGRKRKILYADEVPEKDPDHPEGPYKCRKCDQRFLTIRDLETHRKNHGRAREYLCEDCGFTSTKYKSITIHKKKHRGELEVCPVEGCNFKTVFKDTFKDHMSRHAGIKEHMCSFCGKAYNTRKDMKRHEKTHSEANIIKCPVCDHSSTRRDNLNDHIRRYHPDTATMMGMKLTQSSQKRLPVRPRAPRKPKVETTSPPAASTSGASFNQERLQLQEQVRMLSEQVLLERQALANKERHIPPPMAREEVMYSSVPVVAEEQVVEPGQTHARPDIMASSASHHHHQTSHPHPPPPHQHPDNNQGHHQQVVHMHHQGNQQMTWTFWPAEGQ